MAQGEPTIINYDDPNVSLEELLEAIVKSKRFDEIEKTSPDIQNFQEGGEVTEDEEEKDSLSLKEYIKKGKGKILGFETAGFKKIKKATDISENVIGRIKEIKQNAKKIILRGAENGVDPQEAINVAEEYISSTGYTKEQLNLKQIDVSDIEDPHGLNTSSPNYAPGLRLSSIIGGGVGGTVFGARVAGSALKGAMTGTKWGSRLGYLGALGGAITGGALGAGMAVLGYEAYGDYLNENGMLYTPKFGEYGEVVKMEKGINRPDWEERLNEAKREAIIDAKFGTAFMMARPAVAALRPMFRRVWVGGGKTAYSNSIQKVRDSNELGIGVGTSDVSNWTLIQGLKRAIGRLPLIGALFRRAEQKKALEVYRAAGKTFGLSPKHSVIQMGHDVGSVLEASNFAMRKQVNNAYKAAEDLAVEKKLLINLGGLDQSFNTLVRKKLSPESLEVLSKTNPRLAKLIGNLEEFSKLRLKGSVDFKTYQDIMRNVDDLMVDASKLGTGTGKHAALLLNDFGAQLEKKLGTSINGLGDVGKDVAQKLNTADGLYADMMTLFSTQQSKNLSNSGIKGFAIENKLLHANSGEASRLLEKAFDIGSPEAVENLYKIFTRPGLDSIVQKTSRELGEKVTGKDLFEKAVRIKLMEKFDKALGFKKTGGFTFENMAKPKDGILADLLGRAERKRFDAVLFQRELGLDNLKSARGQALLAALKKTRIDPKDLTKFAKAAEHAFAEDIGSMSVFLARRASIGGAGSLMKAIVPGVTAGAATDIGMAKGLGIVLLARESTKIFANPILLNAFNDALQANLTKAANRGQLWSRAVRELVRQYPDVVADLDNEVETLQHRARSRDERLGYQLMTPGVKEYLEQKEMKTPTEPVTTEPEVGPETPMEQPTEPAITPEPEVEPATIPPNLAEKPPITPLANVVQPIGGMRGLGTQPPGAMRGPVTQQRGQALFGATDPVFGGVFAKKGGLVNLVNSYGKK